MEEAAEPSPTWLAVVGGSLEEEEEEGALLCREYLEAPTGRLCFFDFLVEPLGTEDGDDRCSSWLTFALFSVGGLGVAPSSGGEEEEEGGEELLESPDDWLVVVVSLVARLRLPWKNRQGCSQQMTSPSYNTTCVTPYQPWLQVWPAWPPVSCSPWPPSASSPPPRSRSEPPHSPWSTGTHTNSQRKKNSLGCPPMA